MEDSKERVTVFEAGSVPRNRKATKQRRASAKCCLIVVISLATLSGVFVFALIVKILIYDLDGFLSPHTAAVQRKGHVELDNLSVKPLINSTARFDIRATVWLDVTEHLDKDKTLPPELQVVRYRQWGGKEMKEAIVYSELLFKNASMDSHLHTSTRIRFPIEPLYSQFIGPATLRATFQVVPGNDIHQGLRYNTSVHIYPHALPIGPRTPNTTIVDVSNGTDDAKLGIPLPSTLEQALEHSAINVNLLTVLPTQWRYNDTRANIRSDFGKDSPMFDGSRSNRAFEALNPATLSFSSINRSTLYVSSNKHNIMIPHVRTRSRIMMIREDRNFSLAVYSRELTKATQDVRTKCTDLMKYRDRWSLGEDNTSDDKCQRPFEWSIYENFIHFVTEEGGPTEGGLRNATTDQFKYAPFLTQRVTSSAYRHHRTIPRYLPSENNISSPKHKGDACQVPMLQMDDSQRFFEFDWEVAFSSHKHLRAILAETGKGDDDQVAISDFKDNGTEIRVKTTWMEEAQWKFYSLSVADREHPKSRPKTNAFHFLLNLVVPGVIYILEILYWYTRTTTQGLSQRGQMMSLGSKVFHLINTALEDAEAKNSWVSFSTLGSALYLGYYLVPGLLELVTYLHLELRQGWKISRRPVNKKERDTKRVDSQFGVLMLIVILVLHIIFFRYIVPRNIDIVKAAGCHNDLSEDPTRDSLLYKAVVITGQLASALNHSSGIIQMIFNARATSFAGCFKIVAMLSAGTELLDIAVSRLELLSGWQASRAPISLHSTIAIIVLSVQSYQALTYPGISQAVPDIDDDEDFM